MPTHCSTLDEYLVHVTEQVARHGREILAQVDTQADRTFGFRSPDGEWRLPLGAIKSAFATGEWREEGVGNPITAKLVTRLPPHEVIVQGFKQRLLTAIAEGEAQRQS